MKYSNVQLKKQPALWAENCISTKEEGSEIGRTDASLPNQVTAASD